MKGILEALVGIGAMYCGIAGGEWCVEVCLIVLKLPLVGVVGIKYVGVELCEVTKMGGVQSV